MLVVDGVMAFYTSPGPRKPVDQRKGMASHYYLTPVWQQYAIGNSSNCVQTPGTCPCLDLRVPCPKQGDRLQSMPGNVPSWYMGEYLRVRLVRDKSHRRLYHT
jgi:hypothetical protein